MPTFVSLLSLTDQGTKAAKRIPDRIAESERLCQQLGVTLKDLYMLFGEYDYLAVLEAPDAATVAKLVISVASRGNVKTKTFPAFSREEIADIIKDVS